MNLTNYALLVITFCCVHSMLMAQNEEKEKVTPYDLISSYYETDFEPFKKRNAYVGFAISYTDDQLENVPRLFDRVLLGDQLDYNLTFKGGYFIGDYGMVGVNVNYERNRFEGQLVDQNSDTITRQSIASVARITPNIRTFFPVVKTERLSFSTEIGLGFGTGNTLREDTKNGDEITRTYVDDFIFSVGISPSVVFFAIENFAFEIELNNLVGYEYMSSTTRVNNQDDARSVSNKVNFEIDLLSLRLGLAYFIKGRSNR